MARLYSTSIPHRMWSTLSAPFQECGGFRILRNVAENSQIWDEPKSKFRHRMSLGIKSALKGSRSPTVTSSTQRKTRTAIILGLDSTMSLSDGTRLVAWILRWVLWSGYPTDSSWYLTRKMLSILLHCQQVFYPHALTRYPEWNPRSFTAIWSG
jgi:hypothetical protein